LVKGSHIVLPRLYDGEHAFILQNDDRRVVFMIPWEGRFTLVGTTDIPVAAPDHAEATQDEVDYLCRAVNRYLEKPVGPHAVLWRYAGVRPLYDDGSSDPSAVTRDYTLRLDAAPDEAPVLSVFGGKITTYRRLAEHALEKLAPYFPLLPCAWTGIASSANGHAARSTCFGGARRPGCTSINARASASRPRSADEAACRARRARRESAALRYRRHPDHRRQAHCPGVRRPRAIAARRQDHGSGDRPAGGLV